VLKAALCRGRPAHHHNETWVKNWFLPGAGFDIVFRKGAAAVGASALNGFETWRRAAGCCDGCAAATASKGFRVVVSSGARTGAAAAASKGLAGEAAGDVAVGGAAASTLKGFEGSAVLNGFEGVAGLAACSLLPKLAQPASAERAILAPGAGQTIEFTSVRANGQSSSSARNQHHRLRTMQDAEIGRTSGGRSSSHCGGSVAKRSPTLCLVGRGRGSSRAAKVCPVLAPASRGRCHRSRNRCHQLRPRHRGRSLTKHI